MTTTYNLAPPFKWDFLDNLGNQAAGGTIEMFLASNHVVHKAVYKDAGGTIAWPNPITLDAYGQVGVGQGSNSFPIYWASDAAYYVEVKDVNGALIGSVNNYPAPTGTVVTTDYNVLNQLLNGQFRFFSTNTITPNATTPFEIADRWFFQKNNTSCTDTISILPFSAADLIPEADPIYYVRYLCNVAGTGENQKDFYQKIQDVRTFQGQTITISFNGRSATNSSVQVGFLQNYGIGGSAQTYTSAGNFTLTAGFNKEPISFKVPTLTGTPGPNGDDYVAIILRMPLNVICQVDFTNAFVLSNSNIDQAYPYRTYPIEKALLGSSVPTGTVVDGAFISVPDDFLDCNGALVPVSSYSALANVMTLPFTGTLTNDSNVVTAIVVPGSDTSSLQIGWPVVGLGISPGTTIASIVSATSITLSIVANQSITANPFVAVPCKAAIYATNASVTSGQNLVTGLTSTANLQVGYPVYGVYTTAPSKSFAGNLTGGSNVISGIPNTAGIIVGASLLEQVTAPMVPTYIPLGATVASIVDANTITMTFKAIASSTGYTVYTFNVLPLGATIASIVNATSITLSENATVTSATTSLTFSPFTEDTGLVAYNLPALNGCVTVGDGPAQPGFTSARVLGQYGGEEKHMQTVNELASHTHTYLTTHLGGSGASANGAATDTNDQTQPTPPSSSQVPFNIMQPYSVMKKVIKT